MTNTKQKIEFYGFFSKYSYVLSKSLNAKQSIFMVQAIKFASLLRNSCIEMFTFKPTLILIASWGARFK